MKKKLLEKTQNPVELFHQLVQKKFMVNKRVGRAGFKLTNSTFSGVSGDKSPSRSMGSPRSPRRRSPRKMLRISNPLLKLETDTTENTKEYNEVSLVIEQIEPSEEKLKIGAFKDVEFWFNKAYEASNLDQIEAAIDFYKHGLKVDSINLTLCYNMGVLFSHKNECK